MLSAGSFTHCLCEFHKESWGNQSYLHVLHQAAVLGDRWTSSCLIYCIWKTKLLNLCLIHQHMNKAISGDALAHIWAVSITEVPSVQRLNSDFECLSGVSVELQFKQAKNFYMWTQVF